MEKSDLNNKIHVKLEAYTEQLGTKCETSFQSKIDIRSANWTDYRISFWTSNWEDDAPTAPRAQPTRTARTVSWYSSSGSLGSMGNGFVLMQGARSGWKSLEWQRDVHIMIILLNENICYVVLIGRRLGHVFLRTSGHCCWRGTPRLHKKGLGCTRNSETWQIQPFQGLYAKIDSWINVDKELLSV